MVIELFGVPKSEGAALFRRRFRRGSMGFCERHDKSYLTRRRRGEEGGGGGSVTGGTIESPQMRVGSGGASSMPPQQRNSIEINAPGEWKP